MDVFEKLAFTNLAMFESRKKSGGTNIDGEELFRPACSVPILGLYLCTQ